MYICRNNKSPVSSQSDPKRQALYSPSFVHFAAQKKPSKAESVFVEGIVPTQIMLY